ncbi:uncharacterized protein LOC113367280 [Ctenocephalides felis]|uniref:uncharacterized protein LOC113367280 n=1 Tax=Ctenocephalides felis TaxID=7515 RepID=UPI000E6E55AB|nr:uncharacterized protein LOC113367280 [Ctenocephalides felis]
MDTDREIDEYRIVKRKKRLRQSNADNVIGNQNTNTQKLSTSKTGHLAPKNTTVPDPKITPIIVKGQLDLKVIKYIKDATKIIFRTHYLKPQLYKIFADTIADHEKLKTILRNCDFQFYTYTMQHDIPKKITITGLNPDMTETVVLEELKAKGIKVKQVVQIKKKESDGSQRKLPIYIVLLDKEQEMAKLKEINNIEGHIFKWESYRPLNKAI